MTSFLSRIANLATGANYLTPPPTSSLLRLVNPTTAPPVSSATPLQPLQPLEPLELPEPIELKTETKTEIKTETETEPEIQPDLENELDPTFQIPPSDPIEEPVEDNNDDVYDMEEHELSSTQLQSPNSRSRLHLSIEQLERPPLSRRSFTSHSAPLATLDHTDYDSDALDDSLSFDSSTNTNYQPNRRRVPKSTDENDEDANFSGGDSDNLAMDSLSDDVTGGYVDDSETYGGGRVAKPKEQKAPSQAALTRRRNLTRSNAPEPELSPRGHAERYRVRPDFKLINRFDSAPRSAILSNIDTINDAVDAYKDHLISEGEFINHYNTVGQRIEKLIREAEFQRRYRLGQATESEIAAYEAYIARGMEEVKEEYRARMARALTPFRYPAYVPYDGSSSGSTKSRSSMPAGIRTRALPIVDPEMTEDEEDEPSAPAPAPAPAPRTRAKRAPAKRAAASRRSTRRAAVDQSPRAPVAPPAAAASSDRSRSRSRGRRDLNAREAWEAQEKGMRQLNSQAYRTENKLDFVLKMAQGKARAAIMRKYGYSRREFDNLLRTDPDHKHLDDYFRTVGENTADKFRQKGLETCEDSDLFAKMLEKHPVPTPRLSAMLQRCHKIAASDYTNPKTLARRNQPLSAFAQYIKTNRERLLKAFHEAYPDKAQRPLGSFGKFASAEYHKEKNQ